MKVSLIVAAAENGVIGKAGTLPWHLPNDLKYFRNKTRGHVVIMGRKTYESIGRPLTDRRNIVLSKSVKEIPGCEVFSSLSLALEKLALDLKQDPEKEVFIIGGARLFQDALLHTSQELHIDRIFLTRVHDTIEGDVMLPEIDWSKWTKTFDERHSKDPQHPYEYTFEVYERKK